VWLHNVHGAKAMATQILPPSAPPPPPPKKKGGGKQTTTTTPNSVAFSPRANYTDWPTATCLRNLMPTFVDRVVSRDWPTATCLRNLMPTFVDRVVSRGQHGGSPTVVNLSFLDRSCYFSFK
jgi:hypothetical protein